MAEKDTAAKSKIKRTTNRKLRKPLRDVSNSKKSASDNENAHKAAADDHDDDYSLDRLLLVQSEISGLLNHIDGLVVQTFKLESMGQAQKHQIKSFTQFLSATLQSLKPWVPRFEKVLGKASGNLTCQKIINHGPADTNDENEIDVPKSPELVKAKSLVSPSPLVSWRDNCTVQRGKRLFLLTPLPKATAKSVMSKHHNSVKSSFERFSSAAQQIPRFGLTEITCGDLLNRQHRATLVEEKYDIIDGTKTEETPGCKQLASTSTFSLRDCSMLVMTPRFKMSPPRSCVLLEPVLESSRHGMNKSHKSTPYPGGSELSLCSSQCNEDMVFKCPEHVGINAGLNIGSGNEEGDAPLSWFMSPPKTCVLMEPSDMKNQNNLITNVLLPANIAESDKVPRLFPAQSNDAQHNYTGQKSSFQEMVSNLPKGTPMWKNFGSTMRSGKRPGENTLKKELWTKFEAASSNDFSFYASPVEDDSHKGFMDRLEEVSGEETIPLGMSP